jgi:hypothetical protein
MLLLIPVLGFVPGIIFHVTDGAATLVAQAFGG